VEENGFQLKLKVGIRGKYIRDANKNLHEKMHCEYQFTFAISQNKGQERGYFRYFCKS
jgi:hypothetical protein